jgi:hypothetical protein
MNNNITTESVYNVLSEALSLDNAVRSAAEKQLHTWESDSAPGFIGTLMKIAQEVQSVPEVGKIDREAIIIFGTILRMHSVF